MTAACKKVVLGSCFSCCLLLSLVLFALAAAFWLTFPFVLKSQVEQKVTIQEGHATYEQLQNLTLPLWKSFYFFNLTNPEAFEAGEKPILNEVGPYSYREFRTKNFTNFSSDNLLLTYTQSKLFYFDQNATGEHLSESDTICTVNIPFIAGADKVIDSIVERWAFRALVDFVGAHLYICQNPTALAWNYTDSLIQRLHTFKQYPRTYVNIQVNNSINDTQPSVIRTGIGNITRIGEFVQWNGHKGVLDTWKQGSVCDEIQGTEGLFFHPNLKEGENLTSFVDDAQRTFDLMYVGKVNHLGVEAYRYILANHTFYNKEKYPENACWGPDTPTPNGLIYLGPTQYPTIPVYGSNPHFYDGDPSLVECVEGLNQTDASDLVTTIDVEPITGANIQLKKNLQLNVKIHRYDDMVYLKHIKCVQDKEAFYYPVLWMSEHAELTPEFKQYLEGKGLREVQLFNNILIPLFFALLLALAVLSVVISLCTCCCFIHVSRKSLNKEEREPLLHINSNE